MDLNSFLISFRKNLRHKLSTIFIKQTRTNISTIHHSIKGKGHTTTNDHLVNQIKQIHNKLNLVFYFSAAHHYSHGTGG